MTGRAPRFGILLTYAEASRHGVAAVAQHAERLGFDLLTAWDHIHTGGPDLEVWTALVRVRPAAGRQVCRIRTGIR